MPKVFSVLRLLGLMLTPLLLAIGCGGGGGTIGSGPGSSLTCTAESVGLSDQLQNPVTLFATDNNGVILEVPTVLPAGGENPGGGVLVFGIGTETNNVLGGATQLDGDSQTGDIPATLNGNPNITNGYFDSGSNANFFSYSSSSLPDCESPDQGFYCPTTIQLENATLEGSVPVSFSVDNALDLFSANPSYTAFNDIAGAGTDDTALDLGLPFFFGQNVFTGFEPANGATPPYFAFGGSTPTATSGSNVEPVTVDAGPAGLSPPAINTPYISVTVCVPETSTCQTIEHIEVDTGSVGLRLISSVVTVSLPALKDSSNNPLAECLQFADGTTWGSVVTADITISGESAKGVNVQLIGASSAGSPPATCTGTPENTVDTFGANGIIGVGPFVNDCDSTGECPASGASASYYSCTG